MDILIVDDESSTREALREVLVGLGHKTILEARDGEEALKLLASEKTRIRMIVADWEMPSMDGITLSDRLLANHAFDPIPFLLITSDPPAIDLNELKQAHPRIDHLIFKPFRGKILEEALKQAHANALSRRDGLLWLGIPVPARGLEQALSSGQGGIFKRVFTDEKAGFGAVLIDLSGTPPDATMLSALRKTPLGNSASWIALSRDPGRIGAVRTVCGQFVDAPASEDAAGWARLLEAVRAKLLHAWETELLSGEAKLLLQQKKPRDARARLETILKLDPSNCEAHSWLADILIQENNLRSATHHALAALKVNPCLPKPYIRLLEILPQAEPGRVQEVAAMAKNYCPKNEDVLKAVGAALAKAQGP